MIAIPAFDLRALGSAGQSTAATRPLEQWTGIARSLADLGFRRLHVMDGSATTGIPIVEGVVRDGNARIQVGGVSSASEIEQLLRAGADSVVVGGRGLDEPEWLADLADLYPGSIAVATDVRDRRVVRRGWVRTLPVDIFDVVDELNALPLRELLVTVRPSDEGAGISDLSLLEDVVERSHFPVSIVGGVGRIQDLRALEHRGVAGAVIDAERLLGGALDGRRVAQEFGS